MIHIDHIHNYLLPVSKIKDDYNLKYNRKANKENVMFIKNHC